MVAEPKDPWNQGEGTNREVYDAMDQTALATLLQANQEQAAAKMARVFREKMSKEDKRDKFGDAGWQTGS